jgi:uncharacterized protein YecT (DUF1311 family)
MITTKVAALVCAGFVCTRVVAADCETSTGGVGLDSAQASLQCIAKVAEANDKKLNAAYRRLLGAVKDDADRGVFARTHLLAAQRAWIAFRDSECELKADLTGGAPQWRAVNQAQCVSDLTARRAEELARDYDDAKDN